MVSHNSKNSMIAVPSSVVRGLRARSHALITAKKIGALLIGSITKKQMMKAVTKRSKVRPSYRAGGGASAPAKVTSV